MNTPRLFFVTGAILAIATISLPEPAVGVGPAPLGIAALPTDTATPTDTVIPTPTDTATLAPTPTDTATPTPTDTATPTPTDTATPTLTPTVTPTLTPTVTPTTPAPTPTVVPPPPGPTSEPPANTPGGGSGHGPRSRPPRIPRPHPHRTLRPPKLPHRPGVVRPHPKRRPWPVTLTVRAVPALANVHFVFDGHPLVTAANGVATYTAEHDFSQHTLSLTDSTISTTQGSYRFSRWVGQRDPKAAFVQTVTGLPLRANYAVTAAFGQQEQVKPALVDQNGTPVDPQRVSSISVRSDSGELINMNPLAPTLLGVSRPVLRHGALIVQPVSYTLQSVIVRGANVVDAGRQSFRPGGQVTFVTQFRNLVFTGHDAIFGGARGTAAIVSFPDGGTQIIPFDAQHRAVLNDVPRGTYQVRLRAAGSIASASQFVASKDRTVDLAVISPLDLTVLTSSGLLIALGLLLIGRGQLRGQLVRVRRTLDGRLMLPPTRAQALP